VHPELMQTGPKKKKKNMSPYSQPITLSFTDDNCCVLDGINTFIWRRFVPESRGFT
jgi:hypothetical protein